MTESQSFEMYKLQPVVTLEMVDLVLIRLLELLKRVMNFFFNISSRLLQDPCFNFIKKIVIECDDLEYVPILMTLNKF